MLTSENVFVITGICSKFEVNIITLSKVMMLLFYAHFTGFLPEFSNTCSIIEHNLKSKQ